MIFLASHGRTAIKLIRQRNRAGKNLFLKSSEIMINRDRIKIGALEIFIVRRISIIRFYFFKKSNKNKIDQYPRGSVRIRR